MAPKNFNLEKSFTAKIILIPKIKKMPLTFLYVKK